MANPLDSYISFGEEYQGWGTNDVPQHWNFKDWVSEAIDFGVNRNNRTNFINNQRTILLSHSSDDYMNPTGPITLLPRTFEAAMLCMAHFQARRTAGGAITSGSWSGTITFAHAQQTPDFVGSTWGTFNSSWSFTKGDVYPLSLKITLGTLTSETPASYLQVDDGYVEQMEWSMGVDGDLTVTPTFNFKGVAPQQLLKSSGNYSSAPTVSGSRFSAFSATLTVDSLANSLLDIEEISITTTNGGEGRTRIGGYGFQRYPFTQRGPDTGRIRAELKRANLLKKLLSGTGTFAVEYRFQNSNTEWIRILQPHCKVTPSTPGVDGPAAYTEWDLNYEAFAHSGTPATIIDIYTSYGTGACSLDLPAGSYRGA